MRGLVIVFLFILSQLSLNAAVGDPIARATNVNGEWIDITFEGFTSGATYDHDLDAFENPGVNTPFLTVTSEGYTGDVLGTKQRIVWLVKTLRKAWPNDAQLDETTGGGNLTTRFVLSDYIYSEDTATITIPAGFCVNAGGASQSSTALTAGSVTINSISAYSVANTDGNWFWVPYERITGSTFTLRAFAACRHADLGLPVEALKFTATDGTNTVSAFATCGVDFTMPDAERVTEYYATLNSATLTQGATITCNFIAYPQIGDASAVLDTSTGPAQPTPLAAPFPLLCDKDGTYGWTHVVFDSVSGVDPSVGSDGGKWVGDGEAHGTGSGLTPYATIARALRAGRDFNNATRGRDDIGGVIVYGRTGNYNSLGATISGGYGAKPKTWATVKSYTGETATINNTSGNTNASDLLKFENVVVTSTAANTFDAIDNLWFHDCYLNSSGTGLIRAGTVWYVTHCEIPNFQLRPSSTENASPALIRGNTMPGFARDVLLYTFVGNRKTEQAGMHLFDQINGMQGPRPIPVVMSNKLLGLNSVGGEPLIFGKFQANLDGIIFANNVVENYAAGGAGIISFGTSDLTHYDYKIWHNTVVGDRCFVGYNDAGSVAFLRWFWSEINWYADRWANKGDNFSPEDSNRIGGWPVKFGVGRSGCYFAQNMFSLPGNFYAEFNGISSYEPDESTFGTAAEAQFVNRLSATPNGVNATTAGQGGGNYRIAITSPLKGRPVRRPLPNDLDGILFTLANLAAGAYAAPSFALDVGGTLTIGTLKVQ